MIKIFLELTKTNLIKNSVIANKKNFLKFTRKLQIFIKLRKPFHAANVGLKKKNLNKHTPVFLSQICYFYPLQKKQATVVGILKFRIFNYNEQSVFYFNKQPKLAFKKNKIYSKKKNLKRKNFNFNSKMVNFFFYLRTLAKNKKKNKSSLNFLFFIRSRFNFKRKKFNSKPFLFLNNGDFSKNFKKLG